MTPGQTISTPFSLFCLVASSNRRPGKQHPLCSSSSSSSSSNNRIPFFARNASKQANY